VGKPAYRSQWNHALLGYSDQAKSLQAKQRFPGKPDFSSRLAGGFPPLRAMDPNEIPDMFLN
jgi:hypothetical protein